MCSSTPETHIDGNSLIASNRRLEILQDFALCPGVEATTSYDGHDREGTTHSSGLAEQYRAPFLIALRHYLDLGDQGDWTLDSELATIWLERGLNSIVDNHDTIMIAPHTRKPWQMLARDLTGTVNALMRMISMNSISTSAIVSLREWVQPIWQRLNANSAVDQQTYMSISASPTSHMGQAANYAIANNAQLNCTYTQYASRTVSAITSSEQEFQLRRCGAGTWPICADRQPYLSITDGADVCKSCGAKHGDYSLRLSSLVCVWAWYGQRAQLMSLRPNVVWQGSLRLHMLRRVQTEYTFMLDLYRFANGVPSIEPP